MSAAVARFFDQPEAADVPNWVVDAVEMAVGLQPANVKQLAARRGEVALAALDAAEAVARRKRAAAAEARRKRPAASGQQPRKRAAASWQQ